MICIGPRTIARQHGGRVRNQPERGARGSNRAGVENTSPGHSGIHCAPRWDFNLEGPSAGLYLLGTCKKQTLTSWARHRAANFRQGRHRLGEEERPLFSAPIVTAESERKTTRWPVMSNEVAQSSNRMAVWASSALICSERRHR